MLMGRRVVTWIAQPIVVFTGLGGSFFGSLSLAAAFFPHGYDWRYTVISSLASPRDNPYGYWIASAGLALSGLLLIPFVFYLRMRLSRCAPKLTFWAGCLFFLGALCLTLSGLIVPGHYHILGIGRIHEHLAQVSGVAFCLSLLLYLGAVLCLPPSFALFRLLAIAVVILPVTALTVSRLSLFLAYALCSSTVYRTVKASVLSSLALWEWIGAFCIYCFLGLITLSWAGGGAQPNVKE